jgi:hypothetical protein
MNAKIHPAVIVIVIVALVGGIGYWGFKASQPAPYAPSPGVEGSSGVMPGSTVTADGGFGTVPKGAKPGSKIDVPGAPAPN